MLHGLRTAIGWLDHNLLRDSLGHKHGNYYNQQ
jgi:hypothetical protein